ncbi:unnamed protein product, partial [Rotaria magnacalcarata]
ITLQKSELESNDVSKPTSDCSQPYVEIHQDMP